MSVYIIAEAGVNHNGSLDLARQLVRTAASCGADAVKFQTFRTSSLVTRNARKAAYQIENEPGSNSQGEMLKKLELSNDEFVEIAGLCREEGIDFLTTCFDKASLDFVCEHLDPGLLKIGSGDLTNLPLIVDHARTGKHIIVSTGMATLSDIEDALAALAFGYLDETGRTPPSYQWLKDNYYVPKMLEKVLDRVTVLHCVTDYPARAGDLNLNALSQIRSAFGVRVGYSDHSLGIEACCAAVALGAVCIEKHLTLDRNMEGPDHAASASPQEFRALVKAVRNLEQALVPHIKAPTEREKDHIVVARKYVVAGRRIEYGEAFSMANLEIKRSSQGVAPGRYWDLLGRKSERVYEAGEPIDTEALYADCSKGD